MTAQSDPAPDPWAVQGDEFESLIVCPITDSVAAYGLLSVDAPTLGDLDEDHKVALRLVAGILASAFAERKRP